MIELIPTIGGKKWISVLLDPWGLVHHAYYTNKSTREQEEQQRYKRGEI